MKLTNRQRHLLDNLPRIARRRKAGGGAGYFLAKDDCTVTINSLIVKGVLVRLKNQSLHLAEDVSADLETDAR